MRRRNFIALLGGAAVWPLAARAQQPRGKIPRIGFLLNVQSELVVALFDGLKEAGYIEGQNIIVEKRFAGNMLDRIAEVANELVALDCDGAATPPSGVMNERRCHCLMLSVLSTERIAHLATAQGRCAAAFQSTLCRRWVIS